MPLISLAVPTHLPPATNTLPASRVKSRSKAMSLTDLTQCSFRDSWPAQEQDSDEALTVTWGSLSSPSLIPIAHFYKASAPMTHGIPIHD